MKTMNEEIQEAPRTKNIRKTKPRHNICKLHKISYKEKNLKSSQRKQDKNNKDKNGSKFKLKQCK